MTSISSTVLDHDFPYMLQSYACTQLDRAYDDNDISMATMTSYHHPTHEPFCSFQSQFDNGPFIADFPNYYGTDHRHPGNFQLEHEPNLPSPSYYIPEPTEDSVEIPVERPDMEPFPEDPYETKVLYETNTKLPSFVHILPEYLKPSKKTTTRRGRPPTYQKPGSIYSDSDSLDSDGDRSPTNSPTHSRCRKGAKNILLWKFLLEELRKPGANHIQWVTEREGVFKFVDTAECSRLWGLKKKKEDMNFEKLSRGIRHYYKDGLMSRVDGTRLVYQFNWTQVPRAYRCWGNVQQNRTEPWSWENGA